MSRVSEYCKKHRIESKEDFPEAEVHLCEMPIPDELPIFSWVVEKCPFCKKNHRHGAGRRRENVRNFLGARVAHCFSGDYVIVEKKAE